MPDVDRLAAAPAVPQPRTAARALGAAALLLVAFNLRPALASLAPVLKEAVDGAGLGPADAARLAALPVVCLGLFAFTAPALGRRLGAERAILTATLVLALGTGLRGLGAAWALYLGAVLAGAGIGVVNVLLPGVVKRDFPGRPALMTGVYTMSLCLGASLAAGGTAPLAGALGGWAAALAFWALPALLAAVVWAFRPSPRPPRAPATGAVGPDLWRDPLAWRVTLYMCLQSALAYAVFAWLAPLLRDRGLDAADAGLVASASIMVQAVAAVAAPVLAGLGRDQRAAATGAVGLSLAGFLGCVFAPVDAAWAFAGLLGLGQGAAFAVALTLIVLRAPDPATAARLSGMAQGVGYTLASCGPLAVGLVHQATGGWPATAVVWALISAGAVAAGLGAGRDRLVGRSRGGGTGSSPGC